MKWVKLHTSLHLNDAFLRVSRQARLLFYVLLEVAGAADADGALVVGNGSAMTLAEIARHAALSERTTKAALDELVGIGFVSLRLDAAYVVKKWAEKTGPEETAEARRQRLKRERDARVTTGVTVTRLEGEGEKEVEGEVPASRCACADPAPNETTPEALVDHMLVVFTNTKALAAQNRIRPKWLGWLRLMLADGYSLPQIWAACVVAHGDAHHAPLVQSGGIWANLRRSRPTSQRAAVVPISAASRYGELK